MKVLHIQKAVGLAGSERHLASLLPGLRDRGLDVHMCVLAAGEFTKFVDALQEQAIGVSTIPAGPDMNPFLVAKLRAEIRRHAPDLIHTHLIHADIYGSVAARITRTPRIGSVHATHDFFRRSPYRQLLRAAGRNAVRTIAISEHVARFLRKAELVPSDAIRVVRYGIDASRWIRTEEQRVEARRRMRIEPGTPTVGIASRLFHEKGHDVLIEAFALARRSNADLSLLIAGDGPLRDELMAAAGRILPPGSFRFMGYVEDIASFMSACDILVFPTKPGFGEGFGLAALEAMAAGRALVASNLDSLPEIVTDGETGLLIPPADPQALAAALVSLSADAVTRERLGRAARERAATRFTLDRMVDETVEIYEQALRASE